MTPLPKRKHSTRRKGKRIASHDASRLYLVPCTSCGKRKIPHRVCRHCNK